MQAEIVSKQVPAPVQGVWPIPCKHIVSSLKKGYRREDIGIGWKREHIKWFSNYFTTVGLQP